ncbi:hypothetical protein V1389_06485 [Flavobacterium rakeshii]|uniref:hypothetical protein n=1 Tax=Flavobacterium rakeshii TaxID=1038845 RepID=UPI002E7B16B6|nr:hypothetical protein [Flavobacterium rakeshii]MEE1897973.1 hypothetical protein [Flavobacterium rakeshii]
MKFDEFDETSESKHEVNESKYKNNFGFEEQDNDIDDDDDCEKTIKIDVYNPDLTFGENFEDGSSEKYMLFKITPNGFKSTPPDLVAPGTKVIADWKNLMDHSEGYETIVVDYDTMFGIRLLTFQRYSSFFTCDERILFEALIIKFRAFNFIPFYYSYNTIFKELGIKKDRTVTIIKKFIKIGILESEVKTSIINNRPSQITYYNIVADQIIKLLPEIYIDYNKIDIENDIYKYLESALNKK